MMNLEYSTFSLFSLFSVLSPLVFRLLFLVSKNQRFRGFLAALVGIFSTLARLPGG